MVQYIHFVRLGFLMFVHLASGFQVLSKWPIYYYLFLASILRIEKRFIRDFGYLPTVTKEVFREFNESLEVPRWERLCVCVCVSTLTLKGYIVEHMLWKLCTNSGILLVLFKRVRMRIKYILENIESLWLDNSGSGSRSFNRDFSDSLLCEKWGCMLQRQGINS